MSQYPIFLELKNRKVVIIGAGSIATRKVQSLLGTGARLVIVAERFNDVMTTLCKGTKAELIQDRYSKNYLTDASLAIAVTNDLQLNEQIYKDCQKLQVLCNVVDQPNCCDFFVPAVVKRGKLQIALSTEGCCPAYAKTLKSKLQLIFTEKHGEFLSELQCLQAKIIEEIPDPAERKFLFLKLADDKSFEYFICHGPEKWRDYAADSIRH